MAIRVYHRWKWWKEHDCVPSYHRYYSPLYWLEINPDLIISRIAAGRGWHGLMSIVCLEAEDHYESVASSDVGKRAGRLFGRQAGSWSEAYSVRSGLTYGPYG